MDPESKVFKDLQARAAMRGLQLELVHGLMLVIDKQGDVHRIRTTEQLECWLIGGATCTTS